MGRCNGIATGNKRKTYFVGKTVIMLFLSVTSSAYDNAQKIWKNFSRGNQTVLWVKEHHVLSLGSSQTQERTQTGFWRMQGSKISTSKISHVQNEAESVQWSCFKFLKLSKYDFALWISTAISEEWLLLLYSNAFLSSILRSTVVIGYDERSAAHHTE